MRVAVLGLLCAVAGCAAPPLALGFGVAVTVTFDDEVDDAALARVASLTIVASGDETYETNLAVAQGASRVERFVYRPAAETRRLALEILAEDADGVQLAHGRSAEIALTAGNTAILELTMFGEQPAPMDGGPDDLGDLGADAGPPDGGDGGAQPSCQGLSVALCEDFEGGGLNTSWQQVQNGGTVTVDAVHVHRGTRAMHVHVDELASNGVAGVHILEHASFGIQPGDFHARAYFYLTSALPNTPVALIEAQQAASPYSPINFQINNHHYSMYDHFALMNGYTESALGPSPNQWICVEWAVHVAQTGAMITQVNGLTLTDDEIHDTTSASPNVGQLWVGVELTNGDATPMPAFDLWVDDIIIDHLPIGCDE